MSNQNPLYDNLKPYLECKDYTVSQEKHQVLLNTNYNMLVTFPVPRNLEKYYESDKYISHTNAKQSLLDKTYQLIRKYTLQKKLSLINSFNTKGKSLLDVGAGTGDFLSVCKKNSWTVFGVEPSSNATKIAAEKGIILQNDLHKVKNNQFDVITLWHVLEHVKNLSEYIITLKKLLSINGRLVVAVPNYKSYDANYYKEFWAAYDVPRHLWHFSQESITKLFLENEMCVESILPMKFDAYYVSLLSEKYKTGKMNPFKAFYRGFISNLKAKSSLEYSSLIYVIKKQK